MKNGLLMTASIFVLLSVSACGWSTFNSAVALDNQGANLANHGKYEDALKDFDDAIKLNPGIASAWYNKGLALANLGKNNEALKAYMKAIKLKPDFAEAWNNMGAALIKLGNYKAALKAVNKAMEINPGLKEARENKIFINENLEAYKGSI